MYIFSKYTKILIYTYTNINIYIYIYVHFYSGAIYISECCTYIYIYKYIHIYIYWFCCNGFVTSKALSLRVSVFSSSWYRKCARCSTNILCALPGTTNEQGTNHMLTCVGIVCIYVHRGRYYMYVYNDMYIYNYMTYTCIYIYIYIYVCLYKCMNVYMYTLQLYIYICIHKKTFTIHISN